MIDSSRGFQPTGINASFPFRRGATFDPVAKRGVASGFMRRSATRFIVGSVVRGLKPTATIMRSRRDEVGMPGRGAKVDAGAIHGRGATMDDNRAFQRPDHRVSYPLRRGATVDGSRGFQPTGINASFSIRRGATVDPVATRGVASGFMRRSATRSIVGSVVRGLKPTATIMRSRRDEDAMPMPAAAERAKRIQKNFEGFGV